MPTKAEPDDGERDPEIYAAAGIEFKFDADTVAPLMELVAAELEL